MIFTTESYCSDDLHTNNMFQLPNCSSIHQTRKNSKTGSGITIFIQKELIYYIRHDLNVNIDDTEALCLEIIRL